MSLKETKGNSKKRMFSYQRDGAPRRAMARNGSGRPRGRLRAEAQDSSAGKRTRLEEAAKEATLKYHEPVTN